jgi:hypothetical protein
MTTPAGRARERCGAMANICLRSLPIAVLSSIIFTSHTVQVTTDANASRSMTACTNASADTNMDHGERSRGRFTAVRGVVLGLVKLFSAMNGAEGAPDD